MRKFVTVVFIHTSLIQEIGHGAQSIEMTILKDTCVLN